jgi:hypothetical protein
VSHAGKARGREGVWRAFIGGRNLDGGLGFRQCQCIGWVWGPLCPTWTPAGD